MNNTTVTLGNVGRDKITGFQGTITGRAEYLYGCAQFVLVPPVKDGTIQAGEWFDEGRIEFVGTGINPADVRVEKNGGPNRDAPRA